MWEKRLTNCMLFSRWMWPLSHGDVTFQQEAQDEMLSEDFVPPGCMAVLSAELLTQASLHFNLSSSTETRSLPQPQTKYLYKSQLLLAPPLKVTRILFFCTYTLRLFVTVCPILILLLERSRSQFDGSQAKKKAWGTQYSIHRFTNLDPPPSFLG